MIDKKTSECHLVDAACPVDIRIRLKEREEEEKNIDLFFEIKEIKAITVKLEPTYTIVIGILVISSNNLQKYLESLRIGLSTQTLQK